MIAPLPARDLEVLAFERVPFKYAGIKEAAILERFGCSMTRYFQRLQHITDQPAAELYDPELVRRLRRTRDQRRRIRVEGSGAR